MRIKIFPLSIMSMSHKNTYKVQRQIQSHYKSPVELGHFCSYINWYQYIKIHSCAPSWERNSISFQNFIFGKAITCHLDSHVLLLE